MDSVVLPYRALHHSIFTPFLPWAPVPELSLPSSNLFLLTLKLRPRSVGETPHLPPAGGGMAPARRVGRAGSRGPDPPGAAPRCREALARVGHAGKPRRGNEPRLENPRSPRGPAGTWSRRSATTPAPCGEVPSDLPTRWKPLLSPQHDAFWVTVSCLDTCPRVNSWGQEGSRDPGPVR